MLDVTDTLTVHDWFPVMLPPVSSSDVPFGAAVTLPPQVLTTLGAAAFFRFAGYVSVKVMFDAPPGGGRF